MNKKDISACNVKRDVRPMDMKRTPTNIFLLFGLENIILQDGIMSIFKRNEFTINRDEYLKKL